MSVKQVNLGNLQRKLCKRIRVSFAQNVKTKNYEGLVFEQAKGLVIQWLCCIIIQKQIILLKVNIQVKCV